MHVAVAKYPVEAPRDFAAFAEKQARLLSSIDHAGVGLAVLPEYLSLELAAIFPPATRPDGQWQHGHLRTRLARHRPLEQFFSNQRAWAAASDSSCWMLRVRLRAWEAREAVWACSAKQRRRLSVGAPRVVTRPLNCLYSFPR